MNELDLQLLKEKMDRLLSECADLPTDELERRCKRISQEFDYFDNLSIWDKGSKSLDDNIHKLRRTWHYDYIPEIKSKVSRKQVEADKAKADKRYNIIDFFVDVAKAEEVRKEAEGKSGAALVAVFTEYIRLGVMKRPYPSYGALVKDWGFPNDDRLANNYNQAKKGK